MKIFRKLKCYANARYVCGKIKGDIANSNLRLKFCWRKIHFTGIKYKPSAFTGLGALGSIVYVQNLLSISGIFKNALEHKIFLVAKISSTPKILNFYDYFQEASIQTTTNLRVYQGPNVPWVFDAPTNCHYHASITVAF